ncbi:MAG TPA: FAD/NAD(P)-binding protein [Myxococcales bacterium LLY-WYZ-16_1]|nr:FAD/NAD(P)-binding protein [Myxococcales bacterium LLY-WYZ-16_1]
MSAQPFGSMVPRPTRVVDRVEVGPDLVDLTVEPEGPNAPPPFEPGQFDMLFVPGVGEVPISVSGHPDEPDRRVYTVRRVGSVTRALGALRRGDRLGVRGPFGRPWPLDLAVGKTLWLVAGGLGCAPIRPAILRTLAHRTRFRDVAILVGARSPEDLLYRAELARWRARSDVEVQATVDRASGNWQGPVGLVTELVDRLRRPDDGVIALLCGPEAMMRATARGLLRDGLSASSIFVSLERNMKCGVGLCGHCQLGPHFVCKDGPVFSIEDLGDRFLGGVS